MTFANLSLTKAPQSQAPQDGGQNKTSRGARAWHKGVLGRRMWALGLTILYCILQYPVGTAMIITRSNYRAALYGYNAASALSQRLFEVSKWIGLRQSIWFVPALIGIFLGIEGFSYLFSMVQMDFYESQPMPRRKRFARLYWNGVLIFLVPFVICYALAVLLAVGMGGMSGLLFVEILVQAARMLVLFLASYSIAIFSATLAGNAGIAVCIAGIITIGEFVYYLALQSLRNAFFHTVYYGYDGLNGRSIGELRWFWISPLARMADEITTISAHSTYVPYTVETLRDELSLILPSTACMLVVGAAFLIAAFWLYMRRRSEAAGDTVIYEPARYVFKMIVAIGGGLFLGADIFYSVFTELSGDQNVVAAMTLAAMLISVVLICGVIQGIYDMNARRFLGRFWHVIVAGVVVSAVFAIYRYDLTGYDSYLPAISEVESGALVTYDNSSYVFEDPAHPRGELVGNQYSQNYMEIHDIYTLEQIARIGQETMVRVSGPDAEWMDGWNCAVVYKLKNGKQVARQLYIPYDIDSALMDQIVGSEDYKEGFYPVYQENSKVMAETADKATLLYTNGVDHKDGAGTLWADFCEAYRKDLTQYNFTYATTHTPMGAVVYTCSDSANDHYATMVLPVYPDYAETIAFCKENNLFVEALEVTGTVTEITIDLYTEYDSLSATYTDAEEISEILENSVPQNLGNLWLMNGTIDQNYNINPTSSNAREDAGYGFRLFKADQVPAFVLQDLGAAEETDAAHATVDVTSGDVVQAIDAR